MNGYIANSRYKHLLAIHFDFDEEKVIHYMKSLPIAAAAWVLTLASVALPGPALAGSVACCALPNPDLSYHLI